MGISLKPGQSYWQAFIESGGQYRYDLARRIEEQSHSVRITPANYPEIYAMVKEAQRANGFAFVPATFCDSKIPDNAFFYPRFYPHHHFYPHITLGSDYITHANTQPSQRLTMHVIFHEVRHGHHIDWLLTMQHIYKDGVPKGRKAVEELELLLEETRPHVSEYYYRGLLEQVHRIEKYCQRTGKSPLLSAQGRVSNHHHLKEFDSDLALAEFTGDYKEPMIELLVDGIMRAGYRIDIPNLIDALTRDAGFTHPSSMRRILVLAQESGQVHGDNFGVSDIDSARRWAKQVLRKDDYVRQFSR
jgi:DNA-binding PadR family transcriptional regulator